MPGKSTLHPALPGYRPACRELTRHVPCQTFTCADHVTRLYIEVVTVMVFILITVVMNLSLHAPVPPVPNLPLTKQRFHDDSREPSNTDTSRIANARSTKTKLAIPLGHFLTDGGECRYVDQA